MNILHLSDIHFGRNYPEYNIKDFFEKKNKILDKLINCISEIEDKPEHIIVTGDIAWWGKKKDFSEAYNWFEKLLSALDLTGENITFCVGNHDVDRQYLRCNQDLKENFSNKTLQKEFVERVDNIYEYKNIHEMESCIYEYEKFCEKIGMVPYQYPIEDHMEYSYSVGYKDVVFSSGKVIRIVAFNTALLSSISYIEDDRMWLGKRQLDDLIQYGVLGKTNIYYTIALFHHAERFLHPNEISEYDGRIATLPYLKDNVNLILCGHTETGGKPVLQQQMGGATLLTAGAAYFSDVHPNSFSVIYITDDREMCFLPYTYDGEWKKFSNTCVQVNIKQIKHLPQIGEVIKNCTMTFENGEKTYEIKLKKVGIYKECKNGKEYIWFDNRQDVLRFLDIKCGATILGTNSEFSIELAHKSERNASAVLAQEECFRFLAKVCQSEKKTMIKLNNSDGTTIFSGENIIGKIDYDDASIDLLKKIVEIEEKYDVKLYLPDEIYEKDVKKIDTLLELHAKGYLSNYKLNDTMIMDFDDKNEMNRWFIQAKKCNDFYLNYEKKFECKLFGTIISLGKIIIRAGTYSIDICDMENKLRSFCKGDSRKCLLKANKKFNTFFIRDTNKATDIMTDSKDVIFFSTETLDANFGIFKEK